MEKIIEQLAQWYSQISTEVLFDKAAWDKRSKKLDAIHSAILALRSIIEE